MAQAFPQLPFLDGGARQALLALRFFDWLRIIRLADRTDSWIRTHFMLESLSLADALRVAIACRNKYVHFTVIERVTRRETRILSPEENRYLRNLLIILSKDKINWPHWLEIFNKYPVRAAHMQIAIGQALAHVDQRACQDYVYSISLDNDSVENQECVERCLSVFKRSTTRARRCILWRCAFECWQNWNFGIEKNNNLTAISRSALDYAVVGWLVEGEEKKTLSDIERSFEKKFRTFELQWHKSETAVTSGFFRLLSQYQIKRHAIDQSVNDLYWLPKSIVYTPEAVDSDFTRAKYSYD
ncbi:hypothetical protein [Komagataeibacter rhaeticus]|nr:hypothetical protein [Komagataeibacter rhaeticus]SAY46716.1 hypothetical protein KRIGEM_03571 [Komagataeibacter rhaeticus]